MIELGERQRSNELQHWMSANIIKSDDNLIYKKAGIAQCIFVRDIIRNLLAVRGETKKEWLRPIIFVTSTHRSKSVLLPVYEIDTGWCYLQMRDNFHNWNVSIEVEANLQKEDFEGLVFDGMNEPFSRGGEGMTKLYGPLSDVDKKATVGLESDWDLYTFVWVLKKMYMRHVPMAVIEENLARQTELWGSWEEMRLDEAYAEERKNLMKKEPS